MENIRIEIIVENTAKDYRRVLVQLYRKAWIIAGALYLLTIPPMLWLTFFGAGANPFEEKTYSFAVVMTLFAMLPVVMAMGIKLKISRMVNKAAIKIEPSVFVFDNEAVEVRAESYSSRIGWNNFIRVRELKEDFIFYQNEIVYFSIPKRSFENESTIDEFRHLIRDRMGKKAKLRN